MRTRSRSCGESAAIFLVDCAIMRCEKCFIQRRTEVSLRRYPSPNPLSASGPRTGGVPASARRSLSRHNQGPRGLPEPAVEMSPTHPPTRPARRRATASRWSPLAPLGLTLPHAGPGGATTRCPPATSRSPAPTCRATGAPASNGIDRSASAAAPSSTATGGTRTTASPPARGSSGRADATLVGTAPSSGAPRWRSTRVRDSRTANRAGSRSVAALALLRLSPSWSPPARRIRIATTGLELEGGRKSFRAAERLSLFY